MRQIGQQADVAQQQQLKCAQDELLRVGPLREQLHRQGVVVIQGSVRIIPGQQAHEQLVEITAGKQRFAGGPDMPALPLGGLERAHLGVAAPAQVQRLQRQQHRAELGGGPLDPLGHQRNAAMVAREHFQHQTGLAPVVAVQDESRFFRKPARGHGSLAETSLVAK
ncbi:hypothetical protein D9M68_714330 [compost metagenome]